MVDNVIEVVRTAMERRSKQSMILLGPLARQTAVLDRVEERIRSRYETSGPVMAIRVPARGRWARSVEEFLAHVTEDLEQRRGTSHDALRGGPRGGSGRRTRDALQDRIRDMEAQGWTLVLVVDEIDRLLGDEMKDRMEIAGLRRFLMGRNGCMAVGGAREPFAAITGYREPFYGFFDMQRL